MNIPCTHCEDGTIWKSRYGGNDPDVWATRCSHCDGTDVTLQLCETYRCRSEATDLLDGTYLCPTHLQEALRDLADEP